MKRKKQLFLIASTLLMVVLCLSLAACNHKANDHVASGSWITDGTYHWKACEKGCKGAQVDKAEHVYDNACDGDCNVCGYKRTPSAHVYDNDCDENCNVCGSNRTVSHDFVSAWSYDATNHWHECAICGEKNSVATHSYDQNVATNEYLKQEATAVSKAQYWKSCICGAKSSADYFETDKTSATITNVVMASKTYNGIAVDAPSYNTNSDGAVTIEYKFKDADDSTYSAVAPVNAGEYIVRVCIAESAVYLKVAETAEFEIYKSEVGLLWTAPQNLKYDGNAKIPTVVATQLHGDECSVQIELNEGDNVTFDESFTFKAVSLGNDNYKLPQDVISPSYTITIKQAQPDVATEVWLDKGEESYFKIYLTAGTHYVFDFSPGNQGSVFNFKLYKKGDTALIAEREVIWTSAVDCTIDKTAVLIETTGDYYVKATGIESESDGEVTIATDNHGNLDEHGFCIVCGQYKGTEITFDQNITLSLKKGEKAFYRFAYPGDNLKWKRSFKSPLASGDFTFYVTRNNSTWETITVTNSFKEQITPFDGYYYIVITADTSFNNGQFSIDSNTDEYGFWETEYVGETISVGKPQNISNLDNGQKKYLRFAVNAGFGYGFKRTDNLGIDEIKFYIRQSGVWNEQSLNGACNTLDYTPDDGYCYVIISSDGDSTGTLTILHEFKGQTLAAGNNDVTIKKGKVEYFRFAVEEGRNYSFAENISSGGASATINAYYLLNGVYTKLTVDTTNFSMLVFWHTITDAITDYSDGYIYLRVYANTDVNGLISYGEVNNA